MFNRIPFGGSGGVVSDCNSKVKAVAELSLELGLPGKVAARVAPTRIGQDEELAGMRVARDTFAGPPAGNRTSCEAGSVMGNAHKDGAPIGYEIVNPVGDSYADGIGSEIVIVDEYRRAIPASSGILEVTDEFSFFGIDTDNGKVAALESGA